MISTKVLFRNGAQGALAVLVGAIVVACSSTPTSTSAPAGSAPAGSAPAGSGAAYNIGIMGPLTGDEAFAGVAYRDGALSYIQAANASGGVNGHQLVPIVQDTQAQGPLGIAAVTKFVQQDNVVGIIDEGGTAETGALSSILNQFQVPLVSYACVPPDQVFAPMVTKFCFLAGTASTAMATGQANFTLKLKPSAKVMLVPSNNPYGLGWAKAVTDVITKGGGSIIGTSYIPLVGNDMTAAAAAVASSKPDVVVTILGDAQAVTFEQDLTQDGAQTTPIVNYNGGVALATFQSINNPNYYGAKFDDLFGVTTQGTKDMVTAVKAAGFDPNTPLLWHGYFAAATLVGALRQCPGDCTHQQLGALMDNITIPMNALVPEPYGFTPTNHMGIQSTGVYQLTSGPTGTPTLVATVPVQ